MWSVPSSLSTTLHAHNMPGAFTQKSVMGPKKLAIYVDRHLCRETRAVDSMRACWRFPLRRTMCYYHRGDRKRRRSNYVRFNIYAMFGLSRGDAATERQSDTLLDEGRERDEKLPFVKDTKSDRFHCKIKV